MPSVVFPFSRIQASMSARSHTPYANRLSPILAGWLPIAILAGCLSQSGASRSPSLSGLCALLRTPLSYPPGVRRGIKERDR